MSDLSLPVLLYDHNISTGKKLKSGKINYTYVSRSNIRFIVINTSVETLTMPYRRMDKMLGGGNDKRCGKQRNKVYRYIPKRKLISEIFKHENTIL